MGFGKVDWWGNIMGKDDEESDFSEYEILNDQYNSGRVTINIPDEDWMKNVTIAADTTVAFDSNNVEWNLEPFDEEFSKIKDEMGAFKADVNERLARIEEQMAILRPDELLGEEFEELKEAFESYNKLMEKLRTFKALKDSA